MTGLRAAGASACLATAALILSACGPRETDPGGGVPEPLPGSPPAETAPAPDLTPDVDPDPAPVPRPDAPPASAAAEAGVEQPREVWVKESRNDGG